MASVHDFHAPLKATLPRDFVDAEQQVTAITNLLELSIACSPDLDHAFRVARLCGRWREAFSALEDKGLKRADDLLAAQGDVV